MMNRFLTLLLAASCLTAVGQVPDYVPTEGLVAWYPFNGNANDESQYANQGTVVGASLTEDRFGLPHSAYSFDGNDHIESPHAEWLNHGSNSYSWGGWALNSGTPGWGHLLTKAIHTSNPYSGKSRWLRTGGDSFLALAEGEAGNGYTDQGNGVVCQIESIGNEWFHLIGVIDKESEMKVASIYLNGQLLCSAAIADSSYVSDQEGMLVFGCEDPYINLPSGPQYFVGKLDDLGIWNRALSSEEIQGLFDGIPPTVGCTDENACNFDLEAVVDDGSCTLADCTDPQACNFNSEAACDDGNCVYAPTIDLGEDIVSCEEWVVLEAQDGQFFHWSTGESDSIIEVSQTGFYAVEASSQIGEPNVISGHTFIGRLGQSDYYISEASISWEDARMQSESLGGHLAVITSPEENELVWQGVYGNGLNPGGTNNYQAWIGLYQDFESPDYAEPNGGWRWVTDEAVSYLNWAANRPGNLDQGYFVHMTDANGNCPEGDIVCGTWDDSGISANLQSAFYVLEVESPYGSCTSSDSIFVEFDHGSCFCGPGTIWDAEIQMCIGDGSGDINLDGCVQLNDLLDLLSAYGDCGAEESPWQCGDPLEYQGYDYETVQIGEQCWFAENLRAENYRNGDELLSELSEAEWSSTSNGAVATYGEGQTDCESFNPDGDGCDDVWSLEQFGRLYNLVSLQDSRELCPLGWHSSTDEDWMLLETELGMNPNESAAFEYRGTDQGVLLKSTEGWFNGGAGSDLSGFSGLPGGRRQNSGFHESGLAGFWWSANADGSQNIVRVLDEAYDQVGRYIAPSGDAYSIRCIKSAE